MPCAFSSAVAWGESPAEIPLGFALRFFVRCHPERSRNPSVARIKRSVAEFGISDEKVRFRCAPLRMTRTGAYDSPRNQTQRSKKILLTMFILAGRLKGNCSPSEIPLAYGLRFFVRVILSIAEIRAKRGSNDAKRSLGSRTKKFGSAVLHSE